MSEKKYVGKGRAIGTYGAVAFSVCVESIKEHTFEYKGKNYVKLIVSPMRQPDKFGKTHEVTLDTWKPDPSKRKEDPQTPQNAPQEVESASDDQINPEDIPF